MAYLATAKLFEWTTYAFFVYTHYMINDLPITFYNCNNSLSTVDQFSAIWLPHFVVIF